MLQGGREIPSWDSAYVTSTDWHRPYVSIALQGGYTARMAGLGDLNGDGVLDYVIKQPNFNTDPYHRERYWKRSPEPYQLEAYNGADGKFMWRYDMGWAIGDIDSTHEGIECYAGEQDASQYWLYAANGARLSDKSFGTLAPFAVWWDDDPQ